MARRGVFSRSRRFRAFFASARKLLFCALLWFAWSMQALTLQELEADPKLSPRRFASYFADFDYELIDEVQPHDVFLKRKRGDCDDYATLADSVLSKRNYQTRLITVRMPGLTHVVCYVLPDKVYLDYNIRNDRKKIVECRDSLYAIADKVARSFDANWTTASEFKFEDGLKRTLRTVASTDKRKE